ncbi:MAG TPA: SRPBCC family protein [Myxococcaceae bacterium]|nr:SRPBCC family protein [Myxococcaceae bacterium]
MLRKVLIGLGAVIVVLLIVIATRPSSFRVERSTRIAAPPDAVFGLVNDLHAWDRWSPWAKLDPSMKVTYGGPPAGLGATYHWTGNDKVGEGKMLITESRPAEKVALRLEFLKPMASVNQVDFSLRPQGGGTQVSWAMGGPLDFMGKAMDLVVGMDAMIGKDFEKGLSSLRTESEAEAKRRAEATAASATPPAAGAPADSATPAK